MHADELEWLREGAELVVGEHCSDAVEHNSVRANMRIMIAGSISGDCGQYIWRLREYIWGVCEAIERHKEEHRAWGQRLCQAMEINQRLHTYLSW